MARSNSYRKGQPVQWSWRNGTAEGQIAARYDREVERTIKGSQIKRNGDRDKPAYPIMQDDGDEVLKLGSELEGRK